MVSWPSGWPWAASFPSCSVSGARRRDGAPTTALWSRGNAQPVRRSAAERGNDPNRGGAERQDENRPEHDPRPAVGEVERRAVSGDLGHPEARILRVVVDDAVPALEPFELAG